VISAGDMKSSARHGFIVDFVGGTVGHRFRLGEGRRQALARAAGFTRGLTPSVVDATAGLGRDAFVLASLGAQVTLIERSPEVHALLRDGLARASAAGPEFAAVVARMTLFHADARALLPGLQPDVVMIDPMHPPRRSTALVKKEMRLLRELVGTDPDAKELIEAALASPCKRVVLKWPLRAEPLVGLRRPSHQIIGKTVRYDVFIIQSEASGRK
jgi:16S rRNA (guanine1516-N2)-methyltransferase